MALVSSAVASSDDVVASQYNNLRQDVQQHTHEGTDTALVKADSIKTVTGNRTLNLPTGADDTIVTLTATQTLTNKRFGDSVYINDTTNVGNTLGLTVNQGGADNEILSLKSSDVAHGATSVTETDTYGYIEKAAASSGGMTINGIAGGAGIIGLWLIGSGAVEDGTRNTGAFAPVRISANKVSGISVADPSADKNLVVVQANGTTRFILDSDGDSHQDVGTAWTNFDTHDDIGLLTALSLGVSPDPIREEFGAFLEQHRSQLVDLGLVAFNPDGHHFVNMSRLTMLLVGAVRQVAQRIAAIEDLGLLPGGGDIGQHPSSNLASPV